MNEDFFKQQAARLRNIASMADPFTKRRLLDLAEKYDERKSARRLTPLPLVTMDHQKPSNDQNSDGDPSETR
jgi:hypothetical protein